MATNVLQEANTAWANPSIALDEFPISTDEASPAWPAILLHAATMVICGALMLYWAHGRLAYDWMRSGVLVLLTLFAAVGPLGIFCSWLVGSSTVLRNLAYGCGLTLCLLLFFGLCAVGGAMAAVLVELSGLSLSRL
jgi:hypothetical protein